MASKTVTRQPLRSRFEGCEKHLLSFLLDVLRLPPEGPVVGDIFVECPGVFGEPEGRVGSDLLLQVGAVVGRVGDRHRRLFGFDVDRRKIERYVLVHFGQHEPRQTRDFHSGNNRKLQLDIFAEHPELETGRRPSDREVGGVRLPVERQAERGSRIAGSPLTRMFSGPSSVP